MTKKKTPVASSMEDYLKKMAISPSEEVREMMKKAQQNITTEEDDEPKLGNTTDQLALLDKYGLRFQFYSFFATSTPDNWVFHLTSEYDYVHHHIHFVPYVIPEEQRPRYQNRPFLFFVFSENNRIIRRRLEKTLKQKLTWYPYNHQEDGVENDAEALFATLENKTTLPQ